MVFCKLAKFESYHKTNKTNNFHSGLAKESAHAF
jgi:hypothetical protein